MVKPSIFAIALALTGCAALNMGWYKPGATQEQFAQDKFDCMSSSQMQVNTSNVNGTGSTYYGGGNVTCNTFGTMTNCTGGSGYSQPGHVSGSSASYVTTNVPLFQACMQARGYVWTSQAQVNQYEAEAVPQQATESDGDQPADEGSADAGSQGQQQEHEYDAVPSLQKQADTAGVSLSAYAKAYDRCMEIHSKELDCEYLTKYEVDDYNRGINPDQ